MAVSESIVAGRIQGCEEERGEGRLRDWFWIKWATSDSSTWRQGEPDLGDACRPPV